MKTIERELEEYDLSDLYKLVREKENRSVHVNYAGGWLLAPFIADMVKKTEQAFGELAGSVEAILTLFFLSVTGLRPVDPENPVRVYLERPFHLEDLSDLGFAILTGRSSVLSRTTLFRWVKKCRKSFILRFYDLTRPLTDFIPGTKHPTRGKAMKADKLFYVFELTKKRLIGFKPRPGGCNSRKYRPQAGKRTYKRGEAGISEDDPGCGWLPVSYTHLTLPTKRIV